jgi:CheY-like chemotaxis protein
VISQAARLLGLSHQRLHKKLKGQHKNLRQMVTEILASGQEGNPDPDSDLAITESVSKKSQTIRILHVEDNQTVADAVKETLEIQGWQVDTCADGNTALEKIGSDADYDVLLLDYDLPGVNGLELVRHARELPHRLHTLIVVLSATPVEREAREAGADLFLHKPRGVSLLIESINRLLGEQDHES